MPIAEVTIKAMQPIAKAADSAAVSLARDAGEATLKMPVDDASRLYRPWPPVQPPGTPKLSLLDWIINLGKGTIGFVDFAWRYLTHSIPNSWLG